MRKNYFGSLWIALAFLASGCLTSNALQYSAVSETNQYHLAKVRKGMSQTEVLQIMHRPYSYEAFEFDDEVYDVWFYVTRPTGLGQTRMVPQNLTPLTFRNGYLVGTGYQYYYFAMKEESKKTEVKTPPPPKKKSQEAEDKEFEKALKGAEKKPEKELPPQNEKKEKLPPNVRIVSQQEETSDESEESQEEEKPQDSFGKEEERMQEEDSEQNFNFW